MDSLKPIAAPAYVHVSVIPLAATNLYSSVHGSAFVVLLVASLTA